MIRNKLFQALAMALVLGTALVAPAYAQMSTPPTAQQGFFQGFLLFIEQKFHLDPNQMQAAVKEYRASHPRPGMNPQLLNNREKTRLGKLVNRGKITSIQEAAILNELSTLESKYHVGSNQNLTPAQHRSAMHSFMKDLRNWAKQQKIPVKYVLPRFGMMRRA